MQTVKVYVGENIIIGYLPGITDTGWDEVTAVYATPIKLYSGVNNPIKIRCLNTDQQQINVSNLSIQIGLFEPGTECELLTLAASDYDSANGLVITTFTASELAPLDFGSYELTVTASDNTGNVWPIYIDDNQGTRLTTALLKGPVLAYGDPLPVTFLDVVGVGVVSNSINLTTRPQNSTTATLAANLVAYTGNIVAQASMVSIPTNVDWGNVSADYYSNVSGLIFQNLSGSFAWCRFLLDSADPSGNGMVQSNLFVTGGNIRI